MKRSFKKAESLRSEVTQRPAVRKEILGSLEYPDPVMANSRGWNGGSGGYRGEIPVARVKRRRRLVRITASR